MSKLSRFAVPLAALVSVSLLLAACQAQPAPAPTQAPAPKAQATQPPAAPPATAAPAAPSAPTAAAPKAEPTKPAAAVAPAPADMDPNQEFRVNINGEPPTMDPNLASWDASIAMIELVFESLLKFDKDLNLIPAVARELPTAQNGGISADGKTYTFKLRNDVKFSDGSPVTARDFVFSTRRMLDPTLAAEYASFYYAIVGAEEFNTSKSKDAAELAKLRDAVAVAAKDDYTLEFKLKIPLASFNQLAALWPIAPVKESIVKANSTAEKPDKWTDDPKTYIGNGPFKMTEWVHQDHMTLVANDNYWGTKPKIKKISATMVTDVNANYAAYLNGEREVTTVPLPLIEQVIKDPNLSKQLFRGPRLATFAAQFNTKTKPFDNVKVRQAFATSVDRDAMIDKVRRGVGKAAYSWIPPGMPGHQADLGKQFKLDSAKAKALLAEAGFPNGQGLPKITFSYANTGNNPIMAQFLQEQWKTNLGVEVALEAMEPKALSEAVNKGQYMLGFYGWAADYPDPDNWLPELFGTGAGNNHTYYSNPKLDDVMKAAKAETDTAKRMQMWADAQKTVVDESPVVFLFHDERFVLVKPYVRDIFFNGMDHNAFPGGRSMFQTWLAKR